MTPLKILEVAAEVPPYKGGISRLVGVLSEGLKKEGHQVTLVSPRRRLKEFKISSIPFHRYGNFDVVHVWGPTPFLSDLLLLTNKGTNLVYTHVAEICWKSEFVSRSYRVFHDHLAKNASQIITISNDYASILRTRGLRNVEVIKPPFRFGGVDRPIASLMRSKNSRFTVLYVGQLRPFKAVDVLIRAVAEMKNVNLIIEGRGYLRTQLERLARSLSCDNVRFVNTNGDDDLIKLYETSHVICLPSRNTTEAFGLVLLEGAAFACVPIASNLFGVRENVLQLNGILFQPGSFKRLSERILMLSEDRDLWTKLATKSQRAAQNYANKYTKEYYVNEHKKIFARMS